MFSSVFFSILKLNLFYKPKLLATGGLHEGGGVGRSCDGDDRVRMLRTRREDDPRLHRPLHPLLLQLRVRNLHPAGRRRRLRHAPRRHHGNDVRVRRGWVLFCINLLGVFFKLFFLFVESGFRSKRRLS